MVLFRNYYNFDSIFYATLTILLVVPNTDALICYQCNGCTNPFNANAPGVTQVTAERGEVCGVRQLCLKSAVLLQGWKRLT
ncbi:unnamed protein product [Rotaria sordida]|uniref:Uncharacterized protein n=1 Tax=Rotaria sordida TaxID=392033 RepID=A0A814TNS9_9BILA|nr:unnamed protein product [Rotaria sordida]